MTITVPEEFPMKHGDRLFIRYPNGDVARILVDDVGDKDPQHRHHSRFRVRVETVKEPARRHATSRAFPPSRRGR